MKPPGTYWTTIRMSWLAPVAGPTRIFSAAPSTFAASKPARMALLGARQLRRVEVIAPVRSLEALREGVVGDEDRVLQRRAGLRRGHLEPAHGRIGVVAQRVGDAAVDEGVVVGPKALDRAGDLEHERAVDHVERLLERVQMPIDAAAGLQLGNHSLLVDRAAGPPEQHPARIARCCAPRTRRRRRPSRSVFRGGSSAQLGA